MKQTNSLLLVVLLALSMDVDAQWTQVPSAPTGYINDIVIVNDTFWLAHGSAGVYRSVDNTLTWQLFNEGMTNTQSKQVNQLLVMGDTLFAATTDGIYRSVDNANSWQKKSNGIVVGNGATFAFTMSIYNFNGKLITGAYAGIYTSDDWGETWTATNQTGMHVYPQFFIEHNGIIFGARESINSPYGYQSMDGGESWSQMNISFPTICFMSEPGKLWAGTIDGVWLSEDDGATWEERNNGLSPDPYSAGLIRVNGQLITSLKFGGSGVYHSFDEGLNWEDYSDGLGFFTIISKLLTHDDLLYVISSNGLWQRDVMTTGVSSAENAANEILSQNTPNPFNQETTIGFQIRQAGKVRLDVYNQQGQFIKTLADQSLKAGNYYYSWDGKDQNGQPAIPGIYLYRLVTRDHSETGRMVKIRW